MSSDNILTRENEYLKIGFSKHMHFNKSHPLFFNEKKLSIL
jgi:hypothetical protein